MWETQKMLAGNKHFSLSHTVFKIYPSKNKFEFWVTFILSSANALNLGQTKILSFGKELIGSTLALARILYFSKLKEFADDNFR